MFNNIINKSININNYKTNNKTNKNKSNKIIYNNLDDLYEFTK